MAGFLLLGSAEGQEFPLFQNILLGRIPAALNQGN